LNKLKILILTNTYRFLLKDFAEAYCHLFSEIYVFVYWNPLAEISALIPFDCSLKNYLEPFKRSNLIDLKNKPSNIHVFCVPTPYCPTKWGYRIQGELLLKSVKKIIEFRNLEFDLIHAHFTWPCGYVGVRLGKMLSIPAIVTVHENRDWFNKEINSDDECIYWVWKSADAIIRVNKTDLSQLKNFNKNVFYVPNGFEPSRFYSMKQQYARNVLEIPPDKKIIFNLAALTENKGQIHLIKAMVDILKYQDDVTCYIGGTGPLRTSLQNEINNLGLKHKVILLGSISTNDLVYWMNACTLFVLPSISESFGAVQIEVMACGKPVVATRNGGSEEIIINDMLGILVEPRDQKALAEAILRALETEWNQEYIREYAEQFKWDKISKEIVKIYNSILI